MRFKNGLVVALGLGAIVVYHARRIDAAELQPIKVHDRIVVIVKEQLQPNANLKCNRQPIGSSVTENGSVTCRVAGMVVDVRPDGTLLLEARQSILDDNGLWKYTLTGRIHREDLSPDRTVLSERIADLQISKVQHGKLRDATKRAWFIHLYDWIGPF
ncbi:MAG TPA: flagellar basal body L-ring protein FlgH [Planctomycetaceae bacterium]|jgi:flagellar basal body L-ring protein FlgH|nr:flagellar basal body L-ring protein FlgH [Planctomycetaceae bacterium]